MRTRAERFGAVVSVEAPPALVSVDRAFARRLGVDGGSLWDGESPGLDVLALTAPNEVHLAVTGRCPAGCSGCYADATPDGAEPSLAELCARLDAIAARGAFSVALGGGEPALRDDLGALAAHARVVGLVPTTTTSGLGVTRERVAGWGALAQVNVSWDGPAEVYRGVRGWDGARVAEQAMAVLRDAGIPFGVNTVLTRASFDAIEDLAVEAEARGAVELQLLRWKPAGRARLDYLARRLTDAQVAAVPALLRRLSTSRDLAVRVDCAMVPFFAGDPTIDAAALRRFGVLGCEAGRSLVAQREDGALAPCSFVRDTQGASRDLLHGWDDDARLARFRAFAAAPPEPCAACPLFGACRGGCRVVAGALGETFAPDPECPRVRASASA